MNGLTFVVELRLKLDFSIIFLMFWSGSADVPAECKKYCNQTLVMIRSRLLRSIVHDEGQCSLFTVRNRYASFYCTNIFIDALHSGQIISSFI